MALTVQINPYQHHAVYDVSTAQLCTPLDGRTTWENVCLPATLTGKLLDLLIPPLPSPSCPSSYRGVTEGMVASNSFLQHVHIKMK